jgi:hypothetical protein
VGEKYRFLAVNTIFKTQFMTAAFFYSAPFQAANKSHAFYAWLFTAGGKGYLPLPADKQT